MNGRIAPVAGILLLALAGCRAPSPLEQARSVRSLVVRPAREPGIHAVQYVVIGDVRPADGPFDVYIRYVDPETGLKTFLRKSYASAAGEQKLAPVVRAALFSALARAVALESRTGKVVVIDEADIAKMTGERMDLYYGPLNVGEIQNAIATGAACRVDAQVWSDIDVRRGMELVARGETSFNDPFKKCDSALRVRFAVTPSNDPAKLLKQAEYVCYYIRQVGGNPMPGLGPLAEVASRELLADMEKAIREEGKDPGNPAVAKALTEILSEMPVTLLYTSMGGEYREGKLAFFKDAVDRLLYDRTMAVVPSAELLKNSMAEDVCQRFAGRFFPVSVLEDVVVAGGGDLIAEKKIKAQNIRQALDRLEGLAARGGASRANAANLYNLGVCYEASGNARAAHGFYQRAQDIAVDRGYDEILKLAREALERVYSQ